MTKLSDPIGRIDAWAQRAPDRVAHWSGDHKLTFGGLVAQSDALACQLDNKLGTDRAPVVVLGHKEPEMLIAFLAVVKTGRAYVPLDSSLPPDRVEKITALAKARLTLTPELVREFDLADADAPYARPCVSDTTPFYIMFTSGSTGEPKGVVITHRCLRTFLSWMLGEQHFSEGEEVFLNQAPFSFDLSVMDLYPSLLTGGTLFSITASDVRDPMRLHRLLASSGITTWVSTPSFASVCLSESGFSQERLPLLRRLLFCGETLPQATAEQLLERFPHVELWNTYGPTEATVATSSVRIDSSNVARYPTLPVGYPMPGCQIVIIDDEIKPVAAGTSGEILIAGPNVSPGYLDLPEANRKSFVEFEGHPAYRTGDWGRMADGMLFFEARRDGQIKHHGFRIELGEIETVLNRHPAVAQVAVLLVEQVAGRTCITAYIVFHAGKEVSKEVLREYLNTRLAPYAVPGAFVSLPTLPLTANGKLDRKALPLPIAENAPGRAHVTPRNDTEKLVLEVWTRTLGIENISIDANFFDLGGDSLLAAEIAAVLHDTAQKQVPVAWTFAAPTIEILSSQLTDSMPLVEPGSVVGVHTDGKLPPFFCICGFFDLARHLGKDQPFYQMGWQRLTEITNPANAFQQLGEQALAEIRAAQPAGPYRLGGHSLGAVVAFEVALRLQALGEEVEALVLLEPDLPHPSGWSRLRRFFGLASRFARRLGRLGLREQWHRLLGSGRWHSAVLSAKRKAAGGFAAMTVDEKTLALEGTYVASIFRGKVIVFVAGDSSTRPIFEPLHDWGQFATEGAVLHPVPGGHESFAREPHVRVLAQALREELLKASRSHPINS